MTRHYIYCQEVPINVRSAIHDERRRVQPPPPESRRPGFGTFRYDFAS
jgi:hypothetical protein